MKSKFMKNLLEILSVLAILLAAASILLSKPYKKTLSLDQGRITYDGEVVDHRLNGKGELIYDTGDRYEGNFSHGTFSGKGSFISSQGWSYTGDFQKGQAHGNGKLTLEDGRVFEGKFKQGMYQK